MTRYIPAVPAPPPANTGDSATPAETAATIGALINGATLKDTPVDADRFGYADSVAYPTPWVLKYFTWANLKAALKAYFDTLYSTGSTVLNPQKSYVVTAEQTASLTYVLLTTNDIINFTAPAAGALLTRIFYSVQLRRTTSAGIKYVDCFLDNVSLSLEQSVTTGTVFWELRASYNPAGAIAVPTFLAAGAHTIDLRFKCNTAVALEAKERLLVAEFISKS